MSRLSYRLLAWLCAVIAVAYAVAGEFIAYYGHEVSWPALGMAALFTVLSYVYGLHADP